MSQKNENIIELVQDENGVFVPSKVRAQKPKEEKQQVPRQRQTKQQRAISKIADEIQIPEIKQFLQGANAFLDIAERFKKVFK